jgi:hypothetical protein
MKFDWKFQEFLKFVQEAPNCTWMTHKLMNKIWSSKFENFLTFV